MAFISHSSKKGHKIECIISISHSNTTAISWNMATNNKRLSILSAVIGLILYSKVIGENHMTLYRRRVLGCKELRKIA